MERQLVDAVNSLDTREIERLLESGVNSNACLDDGTPLLHLLVGGERRPRQSEATEIFLSYGASINRQTEDGSSALHIAASWGRLDLIHLLVCNGADVEMVDEDGCRASDLAAEHKHSTCEQWLRACSTALVSDESILYLSHLDNDDDDGANDEWMDTTILVEVPEDSDVNDTTILVEMPEDSEDESYVEAPSQIMRMTDRELRGALKAEGVDPGPLTPSTRPLYVRYLHRLKEDRPQPHSHQIPYSFPNALCRVLLCVDPIPEMSNVEQHLRASFEDRQDWREGVLKTAFNYILLDPRKLPKDFTEVTKREPSPQLKSFKTFLGSVFYVGKGKRSRPYQHLKEATTQKANRKVTKIREIWRDHRGVVSLHIFQSAMPVEAYTREACMVEALGLTHLTNMQRGQVYGVACTWPRSQLHTMGIYYLYRAFLILLIEGLSEIQFRNFKS